MKFDFLVLLVTTMIWGMDFTANKWILEKFSPTWTNALQFIFASFISVPIFIKFKSYKRTFKQIAPTFLTSFFLFMSIETQIIGLKHTTILKNCFLTSFYAVFTPIILGTLFRKKFPKSFWPIICLGIGGMALVCECSINNINYGDGISILCAFFGSCHIISTSWCLKHYESSFEFNAIQCIFVALIGAVVAYVIDGPIDLLGLFTPILKEGKIPNAVLGLSINSFLATFLAYTCQIYSQKKIPPHIVSVIFLMEAPFACLFGGIFFDEKIEFISFIGCLCILSAAYLSSKNEKEKM